MVEIIDVEDGKWCNLTKVKVEQLWDNDHEMIRQVGIFSDDTGIIKFVSWTKSNLPLMEEGCIYDLKDVRCSAFRDRLQVSLNSKTKITRVEDENTGQNSEQSEIPTV